jgi:hypothetical protein
MLDNPNDQIIALARKIAHDHPELIEAMLDDPFPLSELPDQVADALVAAHGEAFFANKHLCKQLIAERVLKEILRLIEEDEL